MVHNLLGEATIGVEQCPQYCLLCKLQSEEGGAAEQLRKVQAFVEELKTLPIAVQTATANEQHYEVQPCGSAF